MSNFHILFNFIGRLPTSQRDRAREVVPAQRKGGKQRKKCRKQKYRDYFIEPNGCRSRRPFKMAKCVGAGPGGGSDDGSCVATKIKKRKVKGDDKDAS